MHDVDTHIEVARQAQHKLDGLILRRPRSGSKPGRIVTWIGFGYFLRRIRNGPRQFGMDQKGRTECRQRGQGQPKIGFRYMRELLNSTRDEKALESERAAFPQVPYLGGILGYYTAPKSSV